MKYPPCFLRGLFLLPLFSLTLQAQTGKLTGILTEAGSKETLAGVSVKITRADDSTKSLHGYSNANGKFTIKNIAPGNYKILFSSLGYRSQLAPLVTVNAGETSEINIELTAVPVRGEAVVVTASRRPEKLTEAPATITYVSAKEIEQHPGLSPIDQLTGIAGIYVMQTGVANSSFASRGRPFVYNDNVLTMEDNRIVGLPSLRVNISALLPTIDDDIDHIEVVRGPGSALYGPDVTEGIVNMITKSPLASQGTTFSLAGGEQDIFQGAFRHAGTIGENFGYKISGSYLRAREFSFIDTFETNARATAIAGGANPDTLRIGKRDPIYSRYTFDARLDWMFAENATAVFNAGIVDFLNGTQGTGIGSIEVQGWQARYYQGRLNYGDLFVQAYLNQSNAGSTFNLRTGIPIIDRSTEFVLQAQHSYLLFPVERLIYGADFYAINPVTDGTIDGVNEANDQINIFGGYLQSETKLFEDELTLVAAARVDKHNRLNSAVFSPRLGFVFKPTEQNIFHLTYNKSYSTPSSQDLFFDYLYSAPPETPFKIRLEGLPLNGWTFTPGIMHSDFSADPAKGIGVDQAASAAIWANYMKEIAALAGNPALAGIPAPPPGAVGTTIGYLNGAGNYLPASDTISNIEGPIPYYVQTVEISYEFKPDEKFDMVADIYHRTSSDGISGRIITPSVVYNSKDVTGYLTQVFKAEGLSDSAAAATANQLNLGAIQQVPVGVISPNEAKDPTAIINSAVPIPGNLFVSMGGDIYCSYQFTKEFSIVGSYSYISKPLTTVMQPFYHSDPYNRTNLVLRYNNVEKGIFAEIRHRWTDAYFTGDVPGFFDEVPSTHLFDLTLGYTIPSYSKLQFILTVSNLFDRKYQSIAGTPQIGRLALLHAHYTL